MRATTPSRRQGPLPRRPIPPPHQRMVPAPAAAGGSPWPLLLSGMALLSGLGIGLWLGLTTGLLAGAAAGVAGWLLSSRRRGDPRDFRDADAVEAATDLAVLAVLPELPDGAHAMEQVLRDPASMLAADLRAIHAALLSTHPAGSPLKVAIGSAEKGEGRSLLAATLGRLLASEGQRVLLIDADWCRPGQHALFAISPAPGMAELLSPHPPGADEVIRTDPVSGLDLIPAGRGRLGARALLSARMKALLADLSDGYDLLLLDLPPLLEASDATLVAGMMDRVLYAIRWRHTRRGRTLGSLTRLRKARGRVAGIVLTRVGPAEVP